MVYLSGKNIVDYVSFGGTQQFSNDANGNITVNGIQGITGSSYDWRNLPYSVTTGSGTVQAGYDAEGNRVRKQLVSGVQTHYVRGANGETVAVYENGSRKFINLLAAGELVGTWDGSQRRYFLKDHLGSVRTTVDQSGNVDGYDDYYPFGLTMPGRSSNSANPNDNYKFTGHERDDEAGINLTYAGARYLDNTTGRWLSIDPYAAKYPDVSPYNYALNNPVNLYDPDGREVCCLDILTRVKTFFQEVKREFSAMVGMSTASHSQLDQLSPEERVEFLEMKRQSAMIEGAFNKQAEFNEGMTEVIKNVPGMDAALTAYEGDLGEAALKAGSEFIPLGSLGKVVKYTAGSSFSEATFKSFARQLNEHGVGSLTKSRNKIQRRLNEHLTKLNEIKEAGGHTSSVEREIRTFRKQLDAIDDLFNQIDN